MDQGGWVNRIASYIRKENDVIYNCGVSGDTTADLLKRFNTECEARAKEAIEYKEQFVLVFSIGLNDSYLLDGKPKITEKQFETNLNKLIATAKSYTKKIFFIEISPVNELETSPIRDNKHVAYRNSRIVKYNEILDRVCKKNNLKIIPVYNTLRKGRNGVLYDGLHLNSKGHKIMADAVKKALIKEKIIS